MSKDKNLSNEELTQELNRLRKLVYLMYSKLPQHDRQTIFDEVLCSPDRNDIQTSLEINKYRL